MLIKKKGEVIYFVCTSCGCEFVVGIRSVENCDGNFYCGCPTCGSRCHTDYAKQPKEED